MAFGLIIILFGGGAAFGLAMQGAINAVPFLGSREGSDYSTPVVYTGGDILIANDGQGSIKHVHPVASSAYRKAVELTGMSWTVIQGRGNAKASHGYHAAEPGSTYTAAIDVSVRGKSHGDIEKIVRAMRSQGWAAWYRSCKTRRDWCGNEHIHAAYAGIPSKSQLEDQITSFLNDGDGLADRAGCNWMEFPATEAEKAAVQFVRSNRAPLIK